MEKIIAVVIMVVIVIGLIATVVMPQSQQVGQMGAASSTQMNTLNTAMQSGNVAGDAVKSEFGLGNNNPKQVVMIDDDTTTVAVLAMDNATGLVELTNPEDVFFSDDLEAAATAGQPASPTGSAVTRTLASALVSPNVMSDALYSRSEKLDTNGIRWVLFVKQVIAR
ncbi:MAG TPA: hypothetical protein DCP90_00255 [Clostridiales bacterium]|nr:MAG: hypothetical protein A2Y22_04455 [Clostridiales bacterium GWD2_32_59]HAN09027.1 hypothetical protein [Clostridiales bacterium]